MIVNEPKTLPTTDQERREVARQRAVAKLEQTAIDAELEAMAKEDEARAKAEEAAAEASRQLEARKVQALTALRAKYDRRRELAVEIRDLVAEFTKVEAELRRDLDQIIGRPKYTGWGNNWAGYIAHLRTSAGLQQFHQTIGCNAPATYGQSVGLAVARGIVEDLIGPATVRVGENRAEWDFQQGA